LLAEQSCRVGARAGGDAGGPLARDRAILDIFGSRTKAWRTATTCPRPRSPRRRSLTTSMRRWSSSGWSPPICLPTTRRRSN